MRMATQNISANGAWKMFAALALATGVASHAATGPRQDVSLNLHWRTAAAATAEFQFEGFQNPDFNDADWRTVDVPHNWDDYGGVHRLVHGNRHGTAWYRREFFVPAAAKARRAFLYFEGVGSYATVWVNGKPAGQHAGGRTTFTLDVTPLLEFGHTNLLAVRADHPEGITDLPWVCGGCSTQNGFSEGSQPMGIFRPVHLVFTGTVRVESFGVHVWNDDTATRTSAVVHVETEIHNYDTNAHQVELETRLLDRHRHGIARLRSEERIAPGGVLTRRQDTAALRGVELWSLEDPCLYTLETTVRERGLILDRVETPFGIRVVKWPAPDAPPGAQFTLNGQPVFINGTCEYEHLLGHSHAFGDDQIRARVAQIEAAGFNAFRDAHQPHNLRYQDYWDRDGILWWPQMAAHIWFDTPAFRQNFKTLMRDWIRERRNSPSLVLWGLENESSLPEDFARECVAIIRELDPTSPSQRLVTVCNGGKGTDWNVPQNWSGTYGGNPATYGDDLKRQHLIGEFGAWRSLGLHAEGGFDPNGVHSEERFASLMETKIGMAEAARNETCGHFHWLFATHENPGRKIGSSPVATTLKQDTQGADAWGGLNGVGPANNKGLLTLWGEPTDAYYLFRANYAPRTDPALMIVSHTWPDRWNTPGIKSNIVVYSNCDDVELFNDFKTASLGRRTRNGRGTHFQWDGVEVRYNVLYAEGRVAGKVVATDVIVLNHLPVAPHRSELNGRDARLSAPAAKQNYLYRVNCGGPDYVDTYGNRWLADRDYVEGETWGSLSWAAEFDNVPPRFGSQRESADAIKGTRDESLFQTYRYGREKLRYRFAVPDGRYRIELFFAEPWYGRGGGDCAGWRLFDVAVNGETKLRNLDLWREAGYSTALKTVVSAQARDGWLEISFPRVAAAQAVISAIAISTSDLNARIPVVQTRASAASRVARTNASAMPQPVERDSVAEVYPAAQAEFTGDRVENDYVILTQPDAAIRWNIEAGLGGAHELQVRYVNSSATPIPVELKIISPDGAVLDTKRWSLAPSEVWRNSGPAGGLSFNAGKYTATLTLLGDGSLQVSSLSVK